MNQCFVSVFYHFQENEISKQFSQNDVAEGLMGKWVVSEKKEMFKGVPVKSSCSGGTL